MTEIRAESIWAAALSHPLRVRILRRMLHPPAVQPVELARKWETTIDTMHRHFHRLRRLGVIERADRPNTGGRASYRLRSHSATSEALWRLGAPPPAEPEERFAALRTGIKQGNLGRIDRGQADPRLSEVLVIADELDFPPEQLFVSASADHADACP